MPLHRPIRNATPLALALAAGLLVTACERAAPPARSESAAVRPGETSATAVAARAKGSGWDATAGPVLLVQGETRDEAIILLPSDDDTEAEDALNAMGQRGAPAVLLGRGGDRFGAQLGAAPQTQDAECRVWPLRAVEGDATSTWSVGFLTDQVQPLALDSVDLLSSRDSALLAAEASRLASAVTTVSAPSFQGLRFTAHDMRRFEAAPGVHALVAHLTRKVNQEANPQEEQTLLIAERDSGVTTGPYRLVYAERTHGMEESSTTPEVIGAVMIAGRPTLVVARDSDAGVAYVLLERVGKGQWRLRWTSGLTRCG
jgi:hypothetical protein